MVQAPQHFHSKAIISTDPASPTSSFYCLYMSLPISSFTPFLSFSLSHLSFSLFLHCPSLLLLSQRLSPQNYPDSSLKSSAWNHQITMEKERIQRGRRGALEEKKSVFHCYTCITLPIAPILTHFTFLAISLSYSEGKETQGFFSSPSLCFSPSLSLCSSLSAHPSALSLSG